MKAIHRLPSYRLRALTIATWLILTSAGQLSAQITNGNPTTTSSLSDYEIINIIKQGNHWDMDGAFNRAIKNRNDTVAKLLEIFRDRGSPLETRIGAAFYLGQMHAAEAADSLAADISILSPRTGKLYLDEASWRGFAAANALVSIGTPAIPAVIRNLEESDDEKVRALSLQTLSRIEGDKDVVQLRLKKVLEAQKDKTKRARLEAAMKSLATAK